MATRGAMATERRLSAELLHEPEPAPVGGPRRTRVVALVEGLDGSRAGAVELDELLVVALEGLLAIRGDAAQALQEVDRLELVGDEASGCDLDRALSGSFQEVEDFLATGREAEERLGFQQEGAVVGLGRTAGARGSATPLGAA